MRKINLHKISTNDKDHPSNELKNRFWQRFLHIFGFFANELNESNPVNEKHKMVAPLIKAVILAMSFQNGCNPQLVGSWVN